MLDCTAYLTIDDSPSERMDAMVDFLLAQNIPAMFFCRGDMLEKNPAAAVRAVQKGFILANHTYAHRRSSEEDTGWFIADIERCEKLIEKTYHDAGIAQPAKYFRFPHVDRGTGGWVVDYDACDATTRDKIIDALTGGLNASLEKRPDDAAFEKKARLQDYLKRAGYTQPFKGVTHAWFAGGEIAAAHDCLFTYSNCDWMVTDRHRGKWPYTSVEDLKQKALSDPFLSEKQSVGVILAHDQTEIVDVTIELIQDLATNGVKFKGV